MWNFKKLKNKRKILKLKYEISQIKIWSKSLKNKVKKKENVLYVKENDQKKRLWEKGGQQSNTSNIQLKRVIEKQSRREGIT